MKPIEMELQLEQYADEETGQRVTRLFPAGQAASHAYFTSTSYDSQSRLILSAQIDERFQLVRIDLEKGTLHQLTDLEKLAPQVYCVCAARDIAIVKDGPTIRKVDLKTGEVETLFEAPAGFHIALPTIDDAGSRIALAVSENAPGFTRTGKIYSAMNENFFFRPRSMIVTVDLDTRRLDVIWGECEWISHVLINRADPNTVVFCHEGGMLPRHRLWVVDTREFNKKCARPLYPESPQEWFVHEYMLADGTLGVQRTVFPEGQAAYDDAISHSVMFLDMDGKVIADYQLPSMRSGHVQSNSDNSVIVADSYWPGSPAACRAGGRRRRPRHEPYPCQGGKPGGDGDDPQTADQYMALQYPEGDRLRVEKLCRHGSSWKSQLSHPHPIFSPDDKHILFSSEVGGTNSTFLVEI